MGEDRHRALMRRDDLDRLHEQHDLRGAQMTMTRAHPVDVAVTRWYHCITRCARRAFLLSERDSGRPSSGSPTARPVVLVSGVEWAATTRRSKSSAWLTALSLRAWMSGPFRQLPRS
jgi:hypothetical protein